jgi:hypothetical protein
MVFDDLQDTKNSKLYRQELESCVGPRGLPFSVAMRTLALSLVDIVQALT